MKRIALAVALLVSLAVPAWAGLYEGWAAYQRGEFDTAFWELMPLAGRGYAEAQFNIGLMYDKGHGLAQDYAEAAKWYRRAAEQGHAFAQSSLGIMYENGQGVPQNYVEAHLWFTLAAARGFEAARKYRERVAEKMRLAQIAAAQRLARRWEPQIE